MHTLKDRYKIQEKISYTVSSHVYKGIDTKTNQPVAIKQVQYKPYIFNLEITSLKKLNHPYIVNLIDYFQEDDFFYIITQWLNGIPITQLSLPVSNWITLFIKILQGIKYIHENGIIHRDLKPENILVLNNNQPQIIDFGLSIMQNEHNDQDMKILGTLPYIPPEQTGFVKSTSDIRSDIYSLGVIFYECLTGNNPFKGKDKSEIIHKQLSYMPQNLKSVIHLEDKNLKIGHIIHKMLQKDIEKRYSHTSYIINSLNKLVEKEQFPSFMKNKISLRKKLFNKIINYLPDFFSNNELILLKGKYGTGKSFLLNQLYDFTKKNHKTLKINVIRSEPLAFLKNIISLISQKYNEKIQIENLHKSTLPILFIENLQRIDEASWNYLLQVKDLKIMSTYDKDEDFKILDHLAIKKKFYYLNPYTLEEIKYFIDEAFEHKLKITPKILDNIYSFCKGNIEILINILNKIHQQSLLNFEENTWKFKDEAKIFSSIDDKNILDFRFSELDSSFNSFLIHLSIFGFSFDIENLKKLKSFFSLKISVIQKLLKKAVDLSILEKSDIDYSFINKEVHHYFYSQLGKKNKVEKHLAIAQKIEKQKSFNNSSAYLFSHYSKTKNFEAAYNWGKIYLVDTMKNYSYNLSAQVFEEIHYFFEQFEKKTKQDKIQFYEIIQSVIKIYIFKGDYDKIISILKEQNSFLQEINDEKRLAQNFINLGRLNSLKGSLKKSKEWYDKAKNLAEKTENIFIMKNVHESIAINYVFSGRFKEAIWHFEEGKFLFNNKDE